MQEHSPECQHTGCPKSHQTHKPISKLTTGHSIASREKKSSFTHQNTEASFPNQETLTSQLSNPTHWVKPAQQKGITDNQNTESPLHTQQSKQDEKAEKYPTGKGK